MAWWTSELGDDDHVEYTQYMLPCSFYEIDKIIDLARKMPLHESTHGNCRLSHNQSQLALALHREQW
jgi:hypothetical protein